MPKPKEEKDNGIELRELLEKTGYTQQAALDLFNKDQVKPMALRTLKTYLALPKSKTRVHCPDEVLEHMKKILS